MVGVLTTLNAQAGLSHPNGQQSPEDSSVQLGTWDLTEESVLLYIHAVGDTSSLYPVSYTHLRAHETLR